MRKVSTLAIPTNWYGHYCNYNGHLWIDLGGLLRDAWPFVELHRREQQPHLPEHSGAAGLSGQRHAAVHVHGVVLQQHGGVHERLVVTELKLQAFFNKIQK